MPIKYFLFRINHLTSLASINNIGYFEHLDNYKHVIGTYLDREKAFGGIAYEWLCI